MDNQQFQRNLASYQQEQEFAKHLATLSTGSIVLIVTFLNDMFVQPEWKSLIGVSIVSFLTSIVGTLVHYLCSILSVEVGPKSPKMKDWILLVFVLLSSLGGFLLGITAFVAFALKNLY